jgi:hypothetical protein
MKDFPLWIAWMARARSRKVKKLDLLEFNDGCGMSRRSKKGLPELDVTRCYIGWKLALNVVPTQFGPFWR